MRLRVPTGPIPVHVTTSRGGAYGPDDDGTFAVDDPEDIRELLRRGFAEVEEE